MKTTVLIERLDLTEAQLDTANRTVRQRLIKAGTSLNKRDYSESVLSKAAPLFEGVKTYANHPSLDERKSRPERSTRDITGWISDVVYENGTIYGTRHFTRTQAGNDSWALVEDIVSGKAPASLLGASINAVGKARTEQRSGANVLVVESIEAVNSVDDVTTPAAGGGFELMMSAGDDVTAMLLNNLSYEEWFEARPEFVKRAQGEMKTVRQDDAVKAAKADADQLTEALTTAQTQIATLTGERDAALEEAGRKARELTVVDMLAKVNLPASYKAELREELPKLPESEWQKKIDKELAKAKASGVLPRVTTTGMSQSVHTLESAKPVKPSVINWAEVDTPEAQKRLLEARKQ